MRSYNTLYYLLTVLLIMGGFASMAQNSYGMMIISGVCIAFGLIFFAQFIQQLRLRNRKSEVVVEFLMLSSIAFIMALRSFQIYIPFIEWIFAAAGVCLSAIYFKRMIGYFRMYESKNKLLAWLLLISYLGVVFFFLAMVTINFYPQLSKYLGILALLFVSGFLILGFLKNRLMVDGAKISVFETIADFHDRFYILLALFLIFALYVGLTGSGVLPKLYSDKYPKAYYVLVGQAEAGKEKPINGIFQFEAFRSSYEQFVQRNLNGEKK